MTTATSISIIPTSTAMITAVDGTINPAALTGSDTTLGLLAFPRPADVTAETDTTYSFEESSPVITMLLCVPDTITSVEIFSISRI